MEGFNINEIEVIDRNKPKLEELLTGEIVKGLDPHSKIKPNSEIEKNEWMQFPDGTTQKVVGDKHEKGGVKMYIPDGTKIITNSINLTTEQAKKISEEYGISVSKKDTYAEAVDKYLKKIGLTELAKEQEEVFSQLKKVMNSDTDEKTLQINKQYLSKKINDIENKKQEKDKDKAKFFNVVFDMQENLKSNSKDYKKDEGFRYGGMSQKNFEAVCKKYGITTEQGEKMLKFGGDYRKFENGGEENWIARILDFESKQGSSTGTGLNNYGIKEEWIQKYPELKGEITKEKAINFIKKEYLPKVKDFPEDVQKRLVDYSFNTGRSIEDLLLYATGKIDLESIQTKPSNTKLYQESKEEILKQVSDPKFTSKLDEAKDAVYKDFWKRKGTPEVYEKTSKDRVSMWGNPEGGSTEGGKTTGSGLFKGDKKIEKQFEYISNLTKNQKFVDNLYKKYEEAWDNKDKQSSNYYKARGKEQYKKLSKDKVIENFIEMQKRNLALKAYGVDYKKIQNKSSDKNTSKYLNEFIKENKLDEKGINIPGYDQTAQEQLGYLAFNDLVDDYNKNPDNYTDLPELKVFKPKAVGAGNEKWGTGKISKADGIYTDDTAGEISEIDFDKIEGPVTTKKEEDKKQEEPKKEEDTKKGETTPIVDKVNFVAKPNIPRLFFTPDQSALPPSPMQAQLKADVRLGRIDPVRLGIESQLQESATQRQFISEQLDSLPPALRASALANLLSTTQDSTNKAIVDTNIINAQNESQAELFNIQQADQESLYAANNALDFEQRQMTAQAKTEEELKRYYDYNRKVNINNFQNQQKLNLLDSIYPDFNLDFMGMSAQYDPNSEWTPERMTKFQKDIQGMLPYLNTSFPAEEG